MANEIMENQNTNEIVTEDQNYVVKRDENGKYVRQAKYTNYSSIQAETKEQKIWMFNILEGDSDAVKGMKDHTGEAFEIHNIITNSYDSIDEDTGEITHGVLTYLLDDKNNVYVTSSKSVYFTVDRIMKLFGKPDENDYEPVKVMIDSEKGKNGTIIKLKMVE